MTAEERHPRWRTALYLPALAAVLVAAGLALAGRPGPEDGVNRLLAAHRGALADQLSSWFSALAATPTVIGVAALCVLALLVVPAEARRWEAAFLGGAVAVQSLVFLLVTLCVERPARTSCGWTAPRRPPASPPATRARRSHSTAGSPYWPGCTFGARGGCRRPGSCS